VDPFGIDVKYRRAETFGYGIADALVLADPVLGDA
jgi:hypothetical protein